MPDPIKVLAFDIGIRNLAWCLLEGTTKPTILGWQNYDLLAGRGHEDTVKAQKTPCRFCKVAAAFSTPAGVTCLRHCPAGQPPLKDLSGVVQKTATLPVLRLVAAAQGLPVKKATKVALMTALAPTVSFPIERLKVKKAVENDLALIHDSIRAFIVSHLELFRQATHICLENQPVLKNPTMKTVQILLFATLRDLLQPGPPPLKLVHAGKKVVVEGAATGDAGYKTRKDAAEAKVISLLDGTKVTDGSTHLAFFKGHTKRSDLADALCMCWDFVQTK
jgi:hypothetical protein